MFLGVEMAAFELGVCSGGERFVSDQDLEKALAKVLETFDGVENLSAEQRAGIASFIRGFTNGIREMIAPSINS